MTSAIQRSDGFWERIEAQLAETNPDIEIERDAFYSQPEWDVFQMRYTSAGGHRLFAWLSVPKEGGPFPALIRMPDYASVHDIIYTPLRHRAVVMNATHRGQRNSDGQVRASYPGLLTDGIESAEVYTLFGAYADALRAVDALGTQSVAELSGDCGAHGLRAGGQPGVGRVGTATGSIGGGSGYTAGAGAPDGAGARSGLPVGRIGRLAASQPGQHKRGRRAPVGNKPGYHGPGGAVPRPDERGTVRPERVPTGVCGGVGGGVARVRFQGLRRGCRRRRAHPRAGARGMAGGAFGHRSFLTLRECTAYNFPVPSVFVRCWCPFSCQTRCP